MDELEHRRFELHAQTDKYQRRIVQATEWVEIVCDRYDNPCLSSSGGKDSTVLHHLTTTRAGRTDIDVFHFDWGVRNVPGIESHVERLTDEFGGTLLSRTSEGVQEAAFARDEHNGMQGLLGWMRHLADERDWDTTLLGIRAEESSKRRDQYSGSPPATDGPIHRQFAPIHRLTTADVWAYIVAHDISYHSLYDDQGQLYDGIDARENRLVTIYDSEFDSLGSRTLSKFLYPSETNELQEIEQSDR